MLVTVISREVFALDRSGHQWNLSTLTAANASNCCLVRRFCARPQSTSMELTLQMIATNIPMFSFEATFLTRTQILLCNRINDLLCLRDWNPNCYGHWCGSKTHFTTIQEGDYS
jgi:hypothetical protein